MVTQPKILHGVRRYGWLAYEALRQSGAMNMYRSRLVLGLTREEFNAIMKHYTEMKDAWGTKDKD